MNPFSISREVDTPPMSRAKFHKLRRWRKIAMVTIFVWLLAYGASFGFEMWGNPTWSDYCGNIAGGALLAWLVVMVRLAASRAHAYQQMVKYVAFENQSEKATHCSRGSDDKA